MSVWYSSHFIWISNKWSFKLIKALHRRKKFGQTWCKFHNRNKEFYLKYFLCKNNNYWNTNWNWECKETDQRLISDTIPWFCCLVCNYCWLAVCIVVLCVLLSYVYWCTMWALFLLLLLLKKKKKMPDCWLEVSIRKVLQPAISTQVFLVSLCLKANAEMVPKIPSCHYMLLI